MPPRRRDPFRRQVLGVLRKPPPKCEHDKPDDKKLPTECPTCGAAWAPNEAQRTQGSGDG